MYSSILISPQHFEYIGLLGFAIPFFMLGNIILMFITWFNKARSKWLFTFLTFIAWPFYGTIYQFRSNTEEGSKGIKILSYNVKWFVDARGDNYDEVINWINDQEADILCFQEFYPLKGIEDRLGEGYYTSIDKEEFHTAIFSKYPILNEGLLFEKSELNNIRFVDLRVREDTIRVYNLHLQSMGIQPNKINRSEPKQAEIEEIGIRFTSASQVRSRQMNRLIDHMSSTDLPMVVVGDFNDIPFSNNYFKLRSMLRNAFEEKGNGFGATFNNKIPFLRIDHQFFSEDIDILDFKTMNGIFYSDHFPLIGIYDLTH